MPRDRMARVHIDQLTWQEFRRAVDDNSIAKRLGELVARDVAAHRRHRVQNGHLTDREVVDALERAAEMSRDLTAITNRLALLRTPSRVGLRVKPDRPRPADHRPGLGKDGERPAEQLDDLFADPFRPPDSDEDMPSNGNPGAP